LKCKCNKIKVLHPFSFSTKTFVQTENYSDMDNSIFDFATGFINFKFLFFFGSGNLAFQGNILQVHAGLQIFAHKKL
jgi:hypothetical protein